MLLVCFVWLCIFDFFNKVFEKFFYKLGFGVLNCFLFILEVIGMLEFVLVDVDFFVVEVVCVVFFIGMLVLLVMGIDDWGFLNIFVYFWRGEYLF